jgi:hypothetical protein
MRGWGIWPEKHSRYFPWPSAPSFSKLDGSSCASSCVNPSIPGDKGQNNIYRSMWTNINLKYFAKRSGHIDYGMIQLQNASKWRHRALSCLSLPLSACLSVWSVSASQRAVVSLPFKICLFSSVTWLSGMLGRCVIVYSLSLSLPSCLFLFLCIDNLLNNSFRAHAVERYPSSSDTGQRAAPLSPYLIQLAETTLRYSTSSSLYKLPPTSSSELVEARSEEDVGGRL